MELLRQDRRQVPHARLRRGQPEQDSGLRPAVGGEALAVLRPEVACGDVCSHRRDVALNELPDTANFDAAEGRYRLEHEEAKRGVSGVSVWVSVAGRERRSHVDLAVSPEYVFQPLG